MPRLGYKVAATVTGLLIGYSAYRLGLPWWSYLIALAVFLAGLVSFSVDSEPDNSGYDKRADDSRGHGASQGGSGGGDC